MTRLLCFAILLLLASTLRAEGTKELIPNAADSLKCVIVLSKGLQNSNEYGYFAVSQADNDNRLWFTIHATGEKVFFGFKKVNAAKAINYVIKNAAGVIQTGTSGNIPTSGTGYIPSYNKAVIGPSAVASGGYSALSFTPSAPGNYYMEFDYSTSWGSQDEKLRYLDITVTTSANVRINGRVWSKNWFLSTEGGAGYNFFGSLFSYSDDQIVTKIDFNGMGPYFFRVACNPTGCANTGNFNQDRRSRAGNFTYEQYKIFLNNPDLVAFPTGILGQVTQVTTTNDCDGTLDINIWVNKSGTVDILLDIDPTPGYQPIDISLADSVKTGIMNVITWNGLNGLGQQVPNGATIYITVTYVNGLTNLPMYDVEYNPNGWAGFKVDLIRPAGPKPLVYWDDLLLPGGTIDLNGCNAAGGCHGWSCPGSGVCSYGDMKTVNTWWYSLSTTMAPITLTYRHSHSFQQNQTICEGEGVQFFGNTYTTSGVYTQNYQNIMGCDSTYKLFLTVNPRPVVNIPASQTVCGNNSVVLNAGPCPGCTYLWSTGATTPAITVTNPGGTYQVTVTNFYPCATVKQAQVSFAPVPVQVPIKHN